MPPSHTPSPADPARAAEDVQLVARLALKDQEALLELYDRFASLLLALILRILGNRADAEEVLQETFLQAWNQAVRYQPERASVSTWLVLLARSRALDRLRSRRAGERGEAAVGKEEGARHASPEGALHVLNSERRERVRRALAELPAEQRQVLELAFYEGLSQSEIAERTATPLGTVKTRSLLAMKKLRQALGNEIRELL